TKPVAQAAASVPEKATSAAGKANPAVVSPKVVSVSAANPAPWSTSAKPKQPKKSLLQIQQEEEEAMKKRQQAEEQLRSQAPMARSFTGSYADRLGGTSSISSAPRSLASIMEEQSKEGVKNASIASPLTSNSATSSRPDGPRTLTLAEAAAPAPPALASQSSRTGTAASPSTTTSAWGSVSSPAASFAMSAAAAAAAAGGSASGSVGSTSASSSGFTSVPATSTNATAPKSHGVKKPSSVLSSVATTSSSATSKNVSAASIVSTTTISAMPSMKFLEWCYSRLGSLRGIDITKFIEVLLTFPMQQSESTLEIIAEQIYAYSPTLNGRAFAEDFMTRRRKDFSSVRGGSLKSAPPNWMQILNSSASAKPSSQSMSQSGSDFVRVASSGASRGNSADSSFQVVGNKKGRRG
ncbi:kinesin-like protein, partial [Coemansia sp. RSA 2607]